jgi:BMFP domain-containing protein YqiC
MNREFQFNELFKDLPELAESASEEMRSLLKTAMSRMLQDMDLVYQEEIDSLQQMLERAEQRVQQLEETLDKIQSD